MRIDTARRDDSPIMSPPWTGIALTGNGLQVGSAPSGPQASDGSIAAGFKEEGQSVAADDAEDANELEVTTSAMDSSARTPPQERRVGANQFSPSTDFHALEPGIRGSLESEPQLDTTTVRPGNGPPSVLRARKADTGPEVAAYKSEIRASYAELKSAIKALTTGRAGGASGSNSIAALADATNATARLTKARAGAEGRRRDALVAIEGFGTLLRHATAHLPAAERSTIRALGAIDKDAKSAHLFDALTSAGMDLSGAISLVTEWERALDALRVLDETNAEISRLAEEQGLMEATRTGEMAKLAIALGLRLEDIEDALKNPETSIARRIAAESARRQRYADTVTWRELERIERLRYGTYRAEADKSIARSRYARDRAQAVDAELTRLAKSGPPAEVSATRLASRSAAAAAAAARRAAKELRRLTQYGHGAAVGAATERVRALTELAHSLATAAEVQLKVVRLAASPHPDKGAQSLILGKAKAEAALALAFAKLKLAKVNGEDTGPGSPAAKDVDERASALKEEQRKFNEAVLSGEIGLEYTAFPDCPPDGYRGPPSVKCDPPCRPWQTAYFSFGFDSKNPACADVLKSPEQLAADALRGGGGKGRGPNGGNVDVHATADSPRAITPPNSPPDAPPLPNPRTDAGGGTHEADSTVTPPDGPEVDSRRPNAPKDESSPPSPTGATVGSVGPRHAPAAKSPPAGPAESGPAPEPAETEAEREARLLQEFESIAFVLTEEIFDEVRRRSLEQYPDEPGRSNEEQRLSALRHGESWQVVNKLVKSRMLAVVAKQEDAAKFRKTYLPDAAARLAHSQSQAELDVSMALLTWTAFATAGGSDQPKTLREEGRALFRAIARTDSLHIGTPGYETGQRFRELAPSVPHLMFSLRLKQGHPEFGSDFDAWKRTKVPIWKQLTGGMDASVGERVAIGVATFILAFATGGTATVLAAGRGAWATLAIGGALGAAEGALGSLITQKIVNPQHPVDWESVKSAGAWGALAGAFAGGLTHAATRSAALKQSRRARGATRGGSRPQPPRTRKPAPPRRPADTGNRPAAPDPPPTVDDAMPETGPARNPAPDEPGPTSRTEGASAPADEVAGGRTGTGERSRGGEAPRKRSGGGPRAAEVDVPISRAEQALVDGGLDPAHASDFVASGAGPRSVVQLEPGQRFTRYAPVGGDAGKGYFVTESGTKYASAAEAKSALDLRRPPAVMQEIEIVRRVDGVESGIKGGAADARQVILPTKDCYRIVREVPIQ